MQRTLAAPLAPVAPLDVFTGSLASFQNPSFLAPLSHQVDPRAGGVVEGLADLAPGQPQAHASRADLPVPATPEPATRVQRRSANPDVPGATAVGASEPIAPEFRAPEFLVPELPVPELSAPPAGPRPSGLAAEGPEAPASEALPGLLPVQRQLSTEPERPVSAVPERRLAAVPDRVPRTAILPPLPLVDLPVVSRRGAERSRPDASEAERSGLDASEPERSGLDASEPGRSVPERSVPVLSTGEPATGESPADGPLDAVITADEPPAAGEPSAPLSGFAAAVSTLPSGDEVKDPGRGVTNPTGGEVPAAAPAVLRVPAESAPTRSPLSPVTRAAAASSPWVPGGPRVDSASEPAVQRAGRPAPLLGRTDGRPVPEEPLGEGLPGAAESWRPAAASLPPDDLPELPVVSRSTTGADWSPASRPPPSWGPVGGSGEQAIPSVGLLSPHRPLVDRFPVASDAEVVQRLDYLPIPVSTTPTRPAARVADMARPAAEAGPTLQRAAGVGTATAVGPPSATGAVPPAAAARPSPLAAGPAPVVVPDSDTIPGTEAALVLPPAAVTSEDGAPDAYGPAVPMEAWTEVALPPADQSSPVADAGGPQPGQPLSLQRQTPGAGSGPPGRSVNASPAPGAVVLAPPVVLRQRDSRPGGPDSAQAGVGAASFAHMFAAPESPVVQRQPAEEAAPPESAVATPVASSPTATTPAAAPSPGGGAPGPSATELEEMARRLYEPLSARLRAELWLDRERSGVLL